jgi:hypothetical protein
MLFDGPGIDPAPSNFTNSILAPSSQFTDPITTYIEACHSFFDPATFLGHCTTSALTIRQEAP